MVRSAVVSSAVVSSAMISSAIMSSAIVSSTMISSAIMSSAIVSSDMVSSAMVSRTTVSLVARQAAINAHSTVFLPFGTYLISDTLQLHAHTSIVGEGLPSILLERNAVGFIDGGLPIGRTI